MIAILFLLVLIIINGLVVLSEIALISAKKSRLDQRAAKGDENAQTALKLQERPEVFLSTAQIFITVIYNLYSFSFTIKHNYQGMCWQW